MKISKLLILASVSGIVAASAIATPAFAWHPKGVIKKFVQNQTSAGPLSDADDKDTAVAAKPGDILKYVIEIRNDGPAGETNEMHFTKMVDELPDGIQLVSDPAKRKITEDIGVVAPGQKVTKEYLVKVTSTKDAQVIINEACFTGNSEVEDNDQDGCDTAAVKVTVPPQPVQPKPEQPKPEAAKPAPQVLSASLPQTGAESFIAPLAAFTSGAAAYAGRLLVIKRRQK